MANKKLKYSHVFLLTAILIYFPVFHHLEKLPIRIFDESRTAINAYEMHNNGNYLVSYYDGKPDMWNTKPPLLIWLQTLGIKLFGTGELAIRIPSAIAALLICVMYILFSWKNDRSIVPGLLATGILITSQGFVGYHGSRTGDYDALLALFTTGYCLCYYLFTKFRSDKYLWMFFVLLTLATLTKGIAALFFLPAIAIYALATKNFIITIKSKAFLKGILIFIIVIAGFYIARESVNPNYLLVVFQNEISTRFMEPLEGHQGSYLFYIENLFSYKFAYWFLLSPLLLLGFFINMKNNLKLFLLILITVFLIIISMAQTKIGWYDIPLYPILSLALAYEVFALMNFKTKSTKRIAFIPATIAFLCLFIVGYINIINKNISPVEEKHENDFYQLSHVLQSGLRDEINLNGYSIVYDGYNAHHIFYVNLFHDKNIQLNLKSLNEITSGDHLLVQQESIKRKIDETFNSQIENQSGVVTLYKILNKK
jgi:4-amino-4-deoxy-L-arabinose transferase-like glycosyltransferase